MNGLRLSFEYEMELSSDKQKRSYGVVAESGTSLINGSQVKKLELDIPGRGQTIKLHYNAEKSQSSKDLSLSAEYSKKPFVPPALTL